jgi:hypothetical protein
MGFEPMRIHFAKGEIDHAASHDFSSELTTSAFSTPKELGVRGHTTEQYWSSADYRIY